MKLNRIITLLISGISIFLLASCPTPLSLEKLALLQDLAAPVIKITSPADYSEYATIIELAGTLQDTALTNNYENSEFSVTYRIPGTGIGGTLPVSLEDGSFTGVVNASSLSGDHLIEFTAFDLNGNEQTVTINIVKPEDGGDISGFTVIPANKQVTISWDPVPGAESYSIFESSYGETITSDEISGTSYTWTGLENGEIYSFQLTANIPEDLGDDAVSSVVSKMPLSIFNLAPVNMANAHKAITLQWSANSNISSYIVERSMNIAGPWETRRVLTQNIFTDDKVEHNATYFYRVSPSDYTEIASACAAGTPVRFTSEEIISTVSPPGANTTVSLVVEGNYAYVANYYAGFAIMDISNPFNPVNVSSYGEIFTLLTQDVAIRENIAYLADYDAGLQIVNISDINNPSLISSCSTPGHAFGIDISGDYAFIADSSAGVQVVDISNPYLTSDSSIVASCATFGGVDKILVRNGYAYAAANNLEVIDISNPELINDSSKVGGCDSIDNGDCSDLCISGNYLYMVQMDPPHLQVVDISNPQTVSDLSIVGTCSLPANARGITVSESCAYIAADNAGLQVVDISDPSSPSILTAYDTSGNSHDIKISGDYAYMADYSGGLVVIDLMKPVNPTIVANSAATTGARDIKTFGNFAFIADDSSGLKIIDITEPENISLTSDITECSLPSSNHGIEICYPYAFLAAKSAGLHIVDISNPLEPELISSIDTSGFANDVDLLGNYAYVADHSYGLQILDITIPSNPKIVASCDTPGTASGIKVSEDYAYICDGDSGLQIIDISNPLNPFISASCLTSTSTSNRWADNIEISGNYALVASSNYGLFVIDISEPSEVDDNSLSAYLSIPGYGYNLDINGDYAAIVGSDKLTIVDITEPAIITADSILSSCSLPNSGMSVSISGSYAYIADYTAGLQIINLSGE